MARTREQHLEWAKQRALDYLERGQIANAVASMISDMQDIETVNPEIMHAGALAANIGDTEAVRRWIKSFRETTPRDIVIVLLTDVVLRWLSEKSTVGQMADRFLALLDQHGYEVVKKK